MNDDIHVEKIARLARLELSESEKTAFRKEIPEILNYVKQLQEVNVDGVKPTAHAVDVVNVMRADEIGESQPLQLTIDNAPAVVNDDLVKVPMVIGGDGGSA